MIGQNYVIRRRIFCNMRYVFRLFVLTAKLVDVDVTKLNLKKIRIILGLHINLCLHFFSNSNI